MNTIVALRYVTTDGPEMKSFYGTFESTQAFIDNTLAVRKHKFFNEYHDSIYTYELHDSTVQIENGDNVLDYSLSMGRLLFTLNGNVYTFVEVPETYNFQYDNWKALERRTLKAIEDKSIDRNVGFVIISMLKVIYQYGFR